MRRPSRGGASRNITQVGTICTTIVAPPVGARVEILSFMLRDFLNRRPSRGGASRNDFTCEILSMSFTVAPPVGARVEITGSTSRAGSVSSRPSRGGASRNCVRFFKESDEAGRPSRGGASRNVIRRQCCLQESVAPPVGARVEIRDRATLRGAAFRRPSRGGASRNPHTRGHSPGGYSRPLPWGRELKSVIRCCRFDSCSCRPSRGGVS